MEKPIRVLEENVIMDPGGIESLLMNLYRNIDKSKVQFDFMLHRKEKGAFDEEIEALGGRIFYAEPFNPLHYFRYIKSMKKIMKEHQEWKVIHAHSELNLWPLKVAKKVGIPVRIAHSHNAKPKVNLKFFFLAYEKLFIKQAANVYFMCSNKAGKWSYGKKAVDANKCILIKNGIEVSKYSFNSKIRKEYRQLLGLSNEIAICHIGRFMEQKNHDFLIDIFYSIHKKNSNTKLFLVSDGRLKTKIKEKVHSLGLDDFVSFLGFRNDVNSLLQAMDCFLLPSFWEGLPFTLIEAQASGLPCFISDTITDEAIVTNLVSKISLKKNADYWSSIILEKIKCFNRKDYSTEIREAGFDIVQTAKMVEDFYLKAAGEAN